MGSPKETGGMRPIRTIGHSNHSLERLLDLLRENGIQAISDVRSAPRSRYVPHFNRERLASALGKRDILYRYLGDTLGGRPESPEAYDREGRVQYQVVAGTSPFQHGIRELLDLSGDRSAAVLCTEGDPLKCHRTLLVARALEESGATVEHISPSGSLIGHRQALLDLMDRWKTLDPERAYRLQGQAVGYRRRG